MTLLERCKSIAKKKLLESHSARYDASKQQKGDLSDRHSQHKTKKKHVHLAEKKKDNKRSHPEIVQNPEVDTIIQDR